ncbi:DUF6081 family protein [Nocardiopsis aegyptia]|uniref:Uncharacterized protein n=1 Tax=Nocardiopsis aegyptia TaxID=220378 RepID=A0A7Z0ERR4_9ACTN|nr:DUF6081 family protein [Nocardiopsis aegyptia]NYJ36130.1 hypothetical protein [Nocardiopsis aegyptia]
MRRGRRRALAGIATASSASLLLATGVVPAAAEEGATGWDRDKNPRRPYVMVWDDYSEGFDAEGEDAKWWMLQNGHYVGDDGIVSTESGDLNVAASGTNPETGEPAFVNTMAQEEDNGGIRGDLDHVKWLAYANHQASTGHTGFDAVPGRELSCQTTMSGQMYGVEDHPFGQRVINAQDDLRLASVGLTVHDVETDMLFEFLFTNEQVYVFYERLAASRPELGYYASYLYTIPVADRRPEDEHEFRVSYDRRAGEVEWYLDDELVFDVDDIGPRLDEEYDEYLMLDHGGVEESVEPRQLACGVGSFTIVDGAQPGTDGEGLVKLSTSENHYFDPVLGEPEPMRFMDEESLESNRIWGQGAEFTASPLVVSSLPARR